MQRRLTCWPAFEFALWMTAAAVVSCASPERWTSQICQGTEPVATVPLFNLWTIEWNVSRVEEGLQNYWQAPIFAPQVGAFAFSEPQPHTMLLAPVTWVCGSVVTYNVLFLVYLGLNGWIMRGLLQSSGCGPLWSRVGGGLLLLLPFVSWQSGVLQLVSVWGPVAVIRGSWQLQQQPHWYRAVLLGVLFGFCYWACNYYALFVTILAPAILVLCWRQLKNVLFWRQLILAGVVGAVCVLPLAYGQWRSLRLVDSQRTPETIESLSAYANDYLINRDVRWSWIDTSRWGHPQRSGWYLGSGTILLVMTGVGVLGGLVSRGRRTWTLFWMIFGGLAFALSLGTHLRWGTFAPYQWLMTWYPGLGIIRSPFRFVLFVQLAQCGLAVEGLKFLEQLGRRWFLPRPAVESEDFSELLLPINPWFKPIGLALSRAYPLLIAVLIAYQIYPSRLRWTPVPPRAPQAAWVLWLKNNTKTDETILCLPLPAGGDVAAYETTIHWMRAGLDHGHPLVNGYSGFFPEPFLQIRDLFDARRLEQETDADYSRRLQTFPVPAALNWLADRNVHLAVVREAELPDPVLRGVQRFSLLFRDPQSGIAIYRMERSPP